MRKAAIVLIAAFALAAATSADGPRGVPSTPAPVVGAGQSRTSVLAGDPLRGIVVCWARGPVAPDGAGPLPKYTSGWFGEPDWLLLDDAGRAVTKLRRRSTGRDRTWYDPTFHGEVLIPAGTKPGRYRIVAGPVTWPVEVVTPPPRARLTNEAVLDPGARLETFQAALDDPRVGVIRLNPGLYRFPKTANFARAAGVTVRGPWAEIEYSGDPPADPVNGWADLFAVADWLVFDRVSFRGPPWLRTFQQGTCPRLTLLDVAFRGGCGLNAPGPGLYVEGGELHGGGAFLGLDGGLLRRLRIHDSLQDRYVNLFAADGNYAEVDVVRERADRGLMLQPQWGDFKNLLILGQQTMFTTRAEGGSEGGVALERGPSDANGKPTRGVRNSLFLHNSYKAGAGGGSALQMEGACTGTLVRDYKATGGWGFVLTGGVEGNDFEHVELRDGAAIRLNPGAANNRFAGGAVVNYQPGAWNLSEVRPVELARTQPVYWDPGNIPPGPGNRFSGWAFVLSPQFTPVLDPAAVLLQDCTYNGAAYPGGK